MYTVLQVCNNGNKLTLSPANYCECLPSYSAARKAARNINFLFGIVRSDRVYSVRTDYEKKNN